MMKTPLTLALTASLALAIVLAPASARAEGSIQQHLTLDLLPLGTSPNNPAGGGFALSYDRYHGELRSNYSLSVETLLPYSSGADRRTDVIASGAFFTYITQPFSLGARVGAVVNNPDSPVAFGALALRLPAIHPDDKRFFGFFFEEIDLGLAGSGNRYASVRLGMLLL